MKPRLRSAVEGGGKAPNFFNSATLNAPLDRHPGRPLSPIHSNQDQGWFENKSTTTGKAFGARDMLMLRPVF